jgi:hypothetical protein
MKRGQSSIVEEEFVKVPPRLHPSTGLGFVGEGEPLGRVDGVEHRQVKSAVPDISIGVSQTTPGPIDDPGQAPPGPKQVEMLIVTVNEALIRWGGPLEDPSCRLPQSGPFRPHWGHAGASDSPRWCSGNLDSQRVDSNQGRRHLAQPLLRFPTLYVNVE